jgi:lysophospholipase L1-like esterase
VFLGAGLLVGCGDARPAAPAGSGGAQPEWPSTGGAAQFGSGGAQPAQPGTGGTPGVGGLASAGGRFGDSGGAPSVGGSAGFASGGVESAATGGVLAAGGAASGGVASSGEPLTIYIASDSTASDYADTASAADQAGWGQMLPALFDPRVTIVNRAAGGRTALWFYLEGGVEGVLKQIKPGDYFFVQFGTNDSNKTATFDVDGVTYPRYADPNTDFTTELLEHYIRPTRERSAEVVLVTPPPRNSAYCGKGNSLAAHSEAMRALGAAEGVTVLDLNKQTFEHLAAICPSPTPEDFFFIKSDGSVDGTHFQENGARHMAAFLGAEMVRVSHPLAGYLKP